MAKCILCNKFLLIRKLIIIIAVCAKFSHTAIDGKNYNTNHYNLDANITIFAFLNFAMPHCLKK